MYCVCFCLEVSVTEILAGCAVCVFVSGCKQVYHGSLCMCVFCLCVCVLSVCVWKYLKRISWQAVLCLKPLQWSRRVEAGACLPRLKPGLKSMNSIAKADLQDGSRSICVFLFFICICRDSSLVWNEWILLEGRILSMWRRIWEYLCSISQPSEGGTNVLIRPLRKDLTLWWRKCWRR